MARERTFEREDDDPEGVLQHLTTASPFETASILCANRPLTALSRLAPLLFFTAPVYRPAPLVWARAPVKSSSGAFLVLAVR